MVENSNPTTKKCPMCAEEIKIEARICRYCKARFDVKTKGYCSQDHQVVEADADGKCPMCQGELIDIRVVSDLIEAKNSLAAQQTQSIQKKPGRPVRWFLGVSALILAAGCFAVYKLAETQIPILFATQTPLPTLTSKPTRTPTPTRTPSPTPVEVNFTNVLDYPEKARVIIVGQLELPEFVSCEILTGCNIILSDPAKVSKSISIYLRMPLASETPAPNQMDQLPNHFSATDLKVRLNDGTYIGNLATVRITGYICLQKGIFKGVCAFKIERAP